MLLDHDRAVEVARVRADRCVEQDVVIGVAPEIPGRQHQRRVGRFGVARRGGEQELAFARAGRAVQPQRFRVDHILDALTPLLVVLGGQDAVDERGVNVEVVLSCFRERFRLVQVLKLLGPGGRLEQRRAARR